MLQQKYTLLDIQAQLHMFSVHIVLLQTNVAICSEERNPYQTVLRNNAARLLAFVYCNQQYRVK